MLLPVGAANRPDQFWLEAAKAIDWVENPPRAHDQSMGWFPEGILNTCHNCLDRHVQAGRGDALALAYDCQTAFKRDPRSASKRDPLFR